MTRGMGMAIAIDYGEITTALGGCLGMARGMASKKQLDRAMRSMTQAMTKEFGQTADTLGSEGTLAHVYEYGMEGMAHGRLWSIYWSQISNGRVGNIVFKSARKPSKPDDRLSASAASKGRSLAQHYFPGKAEHLEGTKILVSVAGQQRHTRRVGGDVASPRSLVFVDRGGNIRFAKYRRRHNEFYGKFRSVFTKYWMRQVGSVAQSRVNTAYRQTSRFGRSRIVRELNGARAASTPKAPLGVSGIFVRDRGRPYTGIRIRQSDVKRVERPVGDRLAKELIRQWQVK